MAKTQKTEKIKTSKKPETTSIKQKPLKKQKLRKRKSKSFSSSATTPTVQNPDPDPDFSSDSGPESESDISTLLEPYTKDQLVELISSAAIKNPSLYSLINEYADRDVSQRKIFVHGLSWNTTREILLAALNPFGEIEDCNVVTDKITGRAKGYAFVQFKTRKAAVLALKDPKKTINNRIFSFQLASVGPVNVNKDQDGGAAGGGDARKIYVSNVQASIDREKLRAFFAKFGEIEIGPIGFDKDTGKSRGFALFVYKTLEGAKKALEEPHKFFEGHLLHCSVATEGKSKSNNQVQVKPQAVQPQQPQQQQPPSQGQVLAAMAAAQNLALFGQHPGLSPLYNGLYGNSTATTGAGTGGLMNPALAGVMSQSWVPTSQVGGLGVGSRPMLGTYRLGQALQHIYPNSQIGQAAMNRGQGAGGSFTGYPSYKWNQLELVLHVLKDSLSNTYRP